LLEPALMGFQRQKAWELDPARRANTLGGASPPPTQALRLHLHPSRIPPLRRAPRPMEMMRSPRSLRPPMLEASSSMTRFPVTQEASPALTSRPVEQVVPPPEASPLEELYPLGKRVSVPCRGPGRTLIHRLPRVPPGAVRTHPMSATRPSLTIQETVPWRKSWPLLVPWYGTHHRLGYQNARLGGKASKLTWSSLDFTWNRSTPALSPIRDPVAGPNALRPLLLGVWQTPPLILTPGARPRSWGLPNLEGKDGVSAKPRDSWGLEPQDLQI
jgi:hypothetical protein